MAIRSKKNQYPGINAHANSWMQNRSGEWGSFHHDHITDITRALNQVLPAGYEARSERSLQIQEIISNRQENTVRERNRYPSPDSTTFDHDRSRQATNLPVPIDSSGMIASVIDTMDITDNELYATVIYKIEENEELGRPVTRIELLSPTNKPPQMGYEQYRDKRNATLRSGMPLIEIDYLHQQPSVVKVLPTYPDIPGSHAYNVVVNDPRPSITEGKTYLHLFDVDSPMPEFDIPLDHGQKVSKFDLRSVYNTTFENTPTLHRLVDYEEQPLKFETYSATDQKRIGERMRILAEMRDAGSDLNVEGPFPATPGKKIPE